MANEIYRVELNEKAFRLGDSGNSNLSNWESVFGSKLITLVDPSKIVEPTAPLSQIKIIPYKEKTNWKLTTKYSIGGSK